MHGNSFLRIEGEQGRKHCQVVTNAGVVHLNSNHPIIWYFDSLTITFDTFLNDCRGFLQR